MQVKYLKSSVSTSPANLSIERNCKVVYINNNQFVNFTVANVYVHCVQLCNYAFYHVKSFVSVFASAKRFFLLKL